MTPERAKELVSILGRIPAERRTELEQACIYLATFYLDTITYTGVEPEIKHSSVMESESGSPSLSSGVTSDVNT